MKRNQHIGAACQYMPSPRLEKAHMSFAILGFGRFCRALCDLLVHNVQEGCAPDPHVALPARLAATEEARARLLAELELIHQQLVNLANDDSLAIAELVQASS